jgi:choline dehydrogenase-like flavoprotein
VGPTRERYDVVVLGGGPAGCVLASRLSEDPGRSVCLVEAGPDYGAYAEGRWPKDLLFANELAVSHDWGIAGGWSSWRAKVLGGCSAHNGCFIAWGSPSNFDGWVRAGDPGWSSAGLEPYRRRGIDMLRARPSRIDDLEPFMRAGLDAAEEIGLPLLEDFDDPRALEGAAPIVVNAVGDVRWNAAFAYLDPARERPNLAIMPDALVDRLSFEGDRAIGTIVRVGGHELEIHADVVVLAAGTYGSPAILLRSGVGPADDLADLSVDLRADLPGVGRNLIDHPRTEVTYRPSAALLTRTHEHLASRPARAQTLIKARSEAAASGTWDLHLMMRVRRSLTSDGRSDPGSELAHLYVHDLAPASRGSVRIASRDAGVGPIVDHGFLSDGAGRDASTLAAGIRLARRLAAARAMEGLLEGELAPGPEVGDDDLAGYVGGSVGGYWHPVGTCAMGPASDAGAVVDATLRLHGFSNVYVADASVMPSIPSANTLLPVIALAERSADLLRTR